MDIRLAGAIQIGPVGEDRIRDAAGVAEERRKKPQFGFRLLYTGPILDIPKDYLYGLSAREKEVLK